jgi:cytochrome c-type biogenesis protein CcsB
MTENQLELLSNQAIVIAAGCYFVAFLVHLAQWATGRSVVAETNAGMAAHSAQATGTDAAGTIVAAPPTQDVDPGHARRERLARIGLVITFVGAGAHVVAVLSRGLAAGRVPWGNMYEFTMTATMMVVLGYLLLYRKFGLDWLSPVVTGFTVVVLMVDVMLLYDPVVELRDALQSPWLVIHVISAITATGAFTLGGMASALYLIKERRLRKQAEAGVEPGSGSGYVDRLPGLVQLDRFAYRTHAFGFPVWTFAALITGPIWAQAAWGRYWGWDPKEVWAFITWVVYAAYLHARATAGWKGRAAAILALIGLATLWFNFVGINFFFGSGSQHSYA